MHPALLLLLRLVHVVGGGIWVGMAVYTTVFLVPAIEDAGPDGGKVMAALQRRGIMTVLPVLAILTLGSGFWLYGRASAGFDPGYVRSAVGLAFGLGGLAALAAYIIGIAVMRPSMMRAARLMMDVGPGSADSDRRARQEEAGRLRRRAARAGRLVAGLLVAALAAMAVARYLT